MYDQTDTPQPSNVTFLSLPRREIHSLPEYLLCPLVGLNLSETHLSSAMADCGVSEPMRPIQQHGWAIAVLKQEDHVFTLWFSQWLDRRHADVISRFEALRRAADLLDVWQQCHRDGQTAAAWWALITHARSDESVLAEAGSQIHLLGHATARQCAAAKRSIDNSQRAVKKMGRSLLQLQREAQEAKDRHAHEQHQLLLRLIAAERQVVHLCKAEIDLDRQNTAATVLDEQLGLARAEIEELKRERTSLEQQLIIEREQRAAAANAPTSSRCVLYIGDANLPTCPLKDWIALRQGESLILRSPLFGEPMDKFSDSLPDVLAADARACRIIESGG